LSASSYWPRHPSVAFGASGSRLVIATKNNHDCLPAGFAFFPGVALALAFAPTTLTGEPG
jgi:hypothetical protein